MARTESVVHRHLDAKMKIWSMEAPDLLISLSLFAVMSLIFSDTLLEIPMVLILPALMLVILVLSKREKPEDFLKHFIQFYSSRGFYSSFERKDF